MTLFLYYQTTSSALHKMSFTTRRGSILLWHVLLGIKLPVGRFCVDVAVVHPLRLVQDVGALVLFPHAVHDKHDQEDGAQEADHGAPDHRGQYAWNIKWLNFVYI